MLLATYMDPRVIEMDSEDGFAAVLMVLCVTYVVLFVLGVVQMFTDQKRQSA